MRKYVKIFFLVIALLLLLGTFVFLWMKSQPKEERYEVISPEKTSIEKKTVATGKVEPRDEVLIKPQISGIVAEVYKEAGEMVKAGDVLALVKVIPEMGTLNAAESRVNVAKINEEQGRREFTRFINRELSPKKIMKKQKPNLTDRKKNW